ncbi:hypothetical protein G3I59_13910 [Amycolatopsis rubida]|uniref:Uncharacterized protein n=1 Tax=Amycolatopsis rubida TaxID=112413 RepID=A0ABX0BMG9_9PSEU|nr:MULTISPECIES: hypothetical protein [Amycolatopsis]MYW91671.1 hypothetical protein [Amycolatopsis rubida]NEC56655.1 hypothetical protein [Amycolatopsis rubida]OAP24434.1 hypothetical protein A4R44_04825 [Amycolatopsis sp. M39]
MTPAPTLPETVATTNDTVVVTVPGSLHHEPQDSVRRALAAYPPDLIARIRARIRAYREAGRDRIYFLDFRHIRADFSEHEVSQVVELLVDLGELGPDDGVYSRTYPLQGLPSADRQQLAGH